MPLWRSLLSVLAAILVGLALRSPKKTVINDTAGPGLVAAWFLRIAR
jgi:hypothetical protein